MDFINFILQNQQTKRYISFAFLAAVIQFIVFKLLYPYPDFFSDSYSYIYAAYANLDLNIWPIGYSKFLRLFHYLTPSDLSLVSFQYFLYILSALYFFLTILYLFQLTKLNSYIIFIFLFLNPLFLYLCNYINSDPIFLSLSILWFTLLIWLIHYPTWLLGIAQALILFMAFTVRNNAYYYPFIALLAFTLSPQPWWKRLVGGSLSILFIIPFVIYTRNIAYKMTGTKQYSLFTGWQLANNALYMYEYADMVKAVSPQVRELDGLSQEFYSHVPQNFRKDYLLVDQGNFFIRAPYSPLKQYMLKHYVITNAYSNVIAWGKSSIVFSEYGSHLIKNNPTAYLWEFMLPNTKNYFFPPLEKLNIYNLGMDEVSPIAKLWFQYKSVKVNSISRNAQGYILYIFRPLFLLINIYLLIILGILWLRREQLILAKIKIRFIIISICLLIFNLLFCIFSTIIVFRYQVFPMICCFLLAILLTQWNTKDRNILANTK